MNRLRARRVAGDRGSVTGYTVIVTIAAIVFAGLVLDAGMAVATKVQAISVAQSAARAGARELDLAHLRATGTIRVDPVAAQTSAQDWLARAGWSGTVNVTGNEVTVTVTVTGASDTQLLGMVGIATIPVGATATATAIPPG